MHCGAHLRREPYRSCFKRQPVPGRTWKPTRTSFRSWPMGTYTWRVTSNSQFSVCSHQVFPLPPSNLNLQHRVLLLGTVTAVEGSHFTLQTRTGSLVQVDATGAIQNELSIGLFVGGVVDVQGIYDSNGVLRASVIQRAKEPATWPSDI